jgi:divalent metal cation (Fe/Co/Zn/Cd) transporter
MKRTIFLFFLFFLNISIAAAENIPYDSDTTMFWTMIFGMLSINGIAFVIALFVGTLIGRHVYKKGMKRFEKILDEDFSDEDVF